MPDNGKNVKKRTYMLFPKKEIIREIRINKTQWVNEHSHFIDH